MDMLNKEQLEQAEIIINNTGGCGVTLANDLIAMVRTLQQQNAQMKEALEWYGSDYPYESSPSEDFLFWEQPEVMTDKGRRARDAIQSIKGGPQ